MKRMFTLLLGLVSLTGTAQVYVDSSAKGANNGTSWTDAFTSLQDALYLTTTGEIWVAKGTYYTQPVGGSRYQSFFLQFNGLKIFGGFAGTETSRSARDYKSNVTILSGDINRDGTPSGNSYHVVRSQNLDQTDTLDGFTITGGNADGMSEHGEGGGMYIENALFYIGHCIFTGNYANTGGGGIYNLNSSPTLANCSFLKDTVVYGYGGGLFNETSNPTLDNCSFSQNSAKEDGGGMYNSHSSPALSFCTFTGNTGNNGGGLKSYYGTPIFDNCIFSGNAATNGGGGMALESGSPVITACNFTENRAGFDGGALISSGASTVISYCNFFRNLSTHDGGGIYSRYSKDTLRGCSFSGDSSATSGGGMYNYSSSPYLVNCSFTENKAWQGGGMYNNLNSKPRLIACRFTGNAVSGSFANGGGMYNDNSSPYLANCSFIGNMGSNGGGGIYNNGLSDTLINCSFSRNQAGSGAGLYNITSGSNTIITNCIFWGNNGPALSGSYFIATYSIIPGGYTGTGNKDLNPQFVNPAANNLALLPCSPAINAGLDGVDTTSTDLAGQPRVFGSVIDMGAFEYQGTPVDTILYVDSSAKGANNGSSWTNAFTRLQDALYLAVSCTNTRQVWVAKGTYYPDEGAGHTNNDRTSSFQLKNNIGIYGGFAGGETELSQRDWKNNITILSGEIQQDSDTSNNAYHVVYCNNANKSVLDGFTITGGNANTSSSPNNQGGGVYNSSGSPTILNCNFTGNRATRYGGAMANTYSVSIIKNCSFSGNVSGLYGGAIENFNTSPSIIECLFTGNTSLRGGGGIYNSASSVTIQACSFVGNSATEYGGGIVNTDTTASAITITNCSFTGNTSVNGGAIENYYCFPSPVITNCSFTGNTGAKGGVLYNDHGSPVVANSILWSNAGGEIYNVSSTPVITWSIVQGGTTDNHNLNQDPRFVDAAQSNLHLQPSSPAINAGNNDSIPPGVTTDLDSHPRIVGAAVDMGAYEYQGATVDTVLYVDSSAKGANNGSSWANAFTRLQDALTQTSNYASVTQIWVAKGTYYPDEGTGHTYDQRTESFNLKNGIALYGGFAGGETGRSQRDWKTNVTILSGDLQQNDEANFTNNGENAYHVVKATGVNNTAVLDGFTITGGKASFDELFWGGGMYITSASPTIANCSFTANWADESGGAVYTSSSAPSFTHCTFITNNAGYTGGAMFNASSSPIITACSFIGNKAVNYGGGIYNKNATPTISNSIFWKDTANNSGGAVYNYALSPVFTNCSFIANRSDYGGVFYNESSSPTITNCILWGNNTTSSSYYRDIQNSNSVPVVTYSLVQDGYTGTGNINTEPMFENAAEGNFRLTRCSAAVNTGSDAANTTLLDLEGNPRKVGTIDMGSYEFQGTVPTGLILYVDASATGANDGTSWTDAFTHLQDALYRIGSCTGEIWVAKGTYYPDEGTGHTNNNRSESFVLKNNTGIYGGFAGGETQRSARNVTTNKTILSGNINKENSPSGNSYHVVRGGGVNNTAILDGFTITGGYANDYSNPHGGGMYNFYYGSPTVANCIFTGNKAYNYGGGIYNQYSAPTLTNCSFTADTASWGGGIYNFASSPTIKDCSFTSDTASYGAGIYNDASSAPEIKNCSFTSNKSSAGALFNEGASPAVTNCNFTGNKALSGAAITNMNNASPIVTGCSFTKNTANAGAGMYNLTNCSPTLINCSFTGNKVTKWGGAIYNLTSSYPIIKECSFTTDTAGVSGGAILNQESSAPAITNCSFIRNVAPAGAGMYNSTSSPTLTNCSFSANKATTSGGGIYNGYTSLPVITNCSFSGNIANEGTVLYNNLFSSPILKNCILWGSSGPIVNAPNTFCNPVVTYSIVQGGYTGTGNKSLDPLFVNAAADSLQLRACSPAINVGNNADVPAGVSKDLDGNTRIFDGTVDMGAYEFQGETDISAPLISRITPTTEYATPLTLAPPNHKMRDITLNYTVTDNSTPSAFIIKTIAVKSNEEINGTGDGDTYPDWIINATDPYHLQLRAERAATGEGRIYTIYITATDLCGNSSTDSVDVHISHNITAPVSGAPFKLGSTVNFAGTFWDKPGNRHTAKWLIDDNTTVKGSVTEPQGAKNGKITGSYRFNAAGVYKLQMNVTDQSGVTTYANTASDLEAIVVIYNPNGGYIYGGGYYNSPAGSLTVNPQVSGKASYGFALNYFKGATLPKGETQFELKVGEFEFNALTFDYLAISGARAQFRGTGKIIGGQSGISFILTAIDGALDGTGIDKVRMKIYNKNTGYVYYDNEPGQSEAGNPKTPVGINSTIVIGGGSAKTGDYVTKAGASDSTSLEVRVIPNPAQEAFNVFVASDNTEAPITLQVFDQWGRKIEERIAGGEFTRLGAAYLPGTYYIHAIQGNKHGEAKAIKLPQ